jgi:hypothetical protein
MKLYLCSDIHNDFHKAIPKEPVDAILCAGDITDYGKREEYREAGAWMTRVSKVAPLAYIPGNHDLNLGSVQLNGRSRNILHETQELEGFSIHGVSLCVCYAVPKLATTWHNMTCNQQAEKAYYEGIPSCVFFCPIVLHLASQVPKKNAAISVLQNCVSGSSDRSHC